MNRNILKRLFAVSLTLLALACSDNVMKDPDQQVTVKLPEFVAPDGIDFNGDYLIIPTPQLYEQTITSLKTSDPVSIAKWTAKLGFVSMREIYQQALKEQDDYLQKLEKEGDVRTRPVIPQTSFVAKHAALFDFDEFGSIVRLKVSNPVMDPLLNKDGIIMVAGHIFQYNEKNVKIIVGGDDRKIALLPEVETTDDKLNIVVNPITVEYKSISNANGRLTHSYSNQKQLGGDANALHMYYFNYSVSISTRLDPIYDTSNPICDPPGCGQARTSKAQDCYCYYPIMSYQGYTLHYATMEARKVSQFTNINTQHGAATNQITATITDTNGTHNYSNTTHNLVNCTVYIYDGVIPAGYDITAGSYTFYEQPDAVINPGSVTYSW